MSIPPAITIDPDEIERLKQFLPEGEGFCTSEIKAALKLTRGQISSLMWKLRDLGLIEPAGKKRIANVHGDITTRPCWKWTDESE